MSGHRRSKSTNVGGGARSAQLTLRFAPLARRGAVLVMALVALLVVGLVASLVIQRVLSSHRQLRQDARTLQAEWLAEAAVDRGLRLRQANPEFTSEEWLAAGGIAKILIEGPAADSPGTVRIHVEARFPDHATERALVERTYLLPLPTKGAAANP